MRRTLRKAAHFLLLISMHYCSMVAVKVQPGPHGILPDTIRVLVFLHCEKRQK